MYSPDVAMGLGSIVYALCKLDGRLHQQATKVACELLAEWPYSDLAICAMFLRDNVGEPAEESCAFGLRRMAAKRVELTKETKKRFVTILLRVARAHEGISREELAFIRQFWRELQRM
ncbi:TerB family tellurite resistance protein [Spirosoma endbachense]|uniref:TerB family tellurite resistance protein n=1 Tax=Spirosoma endbachense TaxID=2666025 RepID=A0A6P1VY43_9BACT|nr:TerB family tellurite resistance protein [Spirosoma endbachense]QHV96677.1 TerB family tellurite resistance protein [Spirosoma endbachense]